MRGSVAGAGDRGCHRALRLHASPAGPSRTLRFAQRVRWLLRSLRLLGAAEGGGVREASAALKASPRTIRSGRRVRFSGKLRGGYVPKGGKVIELQAYERGRWRSMAEEACGRSATRQLSATATGSRSGRQGHSLPKRVRIRHEGTYPFALGYSKSVRVRVR